MLERRTPQEISMRRKAESDLVKLRGEYGRLDSLAPYFPTKEMEKQYEETRQMLLALLMGMLTI